MFVFRTYLGFTLNQHRNSSCTIVYLGTYGGTSSLPTVLAGKCDGATCTAFATINQDILIIKKCFNNPSALDCTSKFPVS